MTDVLWSRVGETALAKGFCCKMEDMKHLCACRRTKLPGRGVHREVRRNRQEMSQRGICDRELTVCSLFWLGPVTS